MTISLLTKIIFKDFIFFVYIYGIFFYFYINGYWGYKETLILPMVISSYVLLVIVSNRVLSFLRI